MAERARCWLDRVVTADVERDGFPFAPASFDALIFADVLEHLLDPWRVLREAVEVLAEDGVVVASIPNVQNLDVLRRLLRGRWDYRERGILDFGHLRFFTLHGIRGLFAQAGLTMEHIGHRYRRSWWRELLAFLTAGRAAPSGHDSISSSAAARYNKPSWRIRSKDSNSSTLRSPRPGSIRLRRRSPTGFAAVTAIRRRSSEPPGRACPAAIIFSSTRRPAPARHSPPFCPF